MHPSEVHANLGWVGEGGGRGRLRRFRSFTPGISRSFRMTVCSAANLRRAALLIAESADIARDRKKQEPLARRYSDTEKSQGIERLAPISSNWTKTGRAEGLR